jgi:hypothetical protein
MMLIVRIMACHFLNKTITVKNHAGKVYRVSHAPHPQLVAFIDYDLNVIFLPMQYEMQNGNESDGNIVLLIKHSTIFCSVL